MVAARTSWSTATGRSPGETFARVFGGQVLSATGEPAHRVRPAAERRERINVLLVGVDTTKKRTETLTDTMMVASLDPVGHTVSMVSLPRDLINVPLGNGRRLRTEAQLAAARMPTAIPKNSPTAACDASRTRSARCSRSRSTTTRKLDFAGFVKMVDAVGGVDINVKKALEDPSYDGYGLGREGLHHHDGHAPPRRRAGARLRPDPQGPRRERLHPRRRQQQILVALKEQATSGGSLLFELPRSSTRSARRSVRHPGDRLPDLAAIMDEMAAEGRDPRGHPPPARRPEQTRYGDLAGPEPQAIRAMAAKLFSAPGTSPCRGRRPKPTPKPDPSETAEP